MNAKLLIVAALVLMVPTVGMELNTMLQCDSTNNTMDSLMNLSHHDNYQQYTVSQSKHSSDRTALGPIGFVLLLAIIVIRYRPMARYTNIDHKRQKIVVESAMRAFEKKAENEPVLGHLQEDATNLLNIFKQNIGSVYEYPLKFDFFTFNGFENKIHKIKLYDGDIIAVTLHIFPDDFKENLEFHNHSKHMLLQNFCGEYTHTTWRINTDKPGKLYKFPYERNERNEYEVINGELEYMDISNYKPGNWRCIHPVTMHTITANKNTQRIISFVIKSKLDPNNDRFVLCKEPTLNRPTLKRSEVFGEEREKVLKYIVDSAN